MGGGSSEFALARPGQEPRFASLPLGVLTLSQAHPLGDPPEPERVAALNADLAGKLRRFRDQTFPADRRQAPRLVGTAGRGHHPGGHASKADALRSEPGQ